MDLFRRRRYASPFRESRSNTRPFCGDLPALSYPITSEYCRANRPGCSYDKVRGGRGHRQAGWGRRFQTIVQTPNGDLLQQQGAFGHHARKACWCRRNLIRCRNCQPCGRLHIQVAAKLREFATTRIARRFDRTSHQNGHRRQPYTWALRPKESCLWPWRVPHP